MNTHGSISFTSLLVRLRHHWRGLTASTALTGATANVAFTQGGFVLAVLGLAAAGICAVVLVPGWIAGTSVVRHAHRTQQEIAAIEARRRKELVRAGEQS